MVPIVHSVAPAVPTNNVSNMGILMHVLYKQCNELALMLVH